MFSNQFLKLLLGDFYPVKESRPTQVRVAPSENGNLNPTSGRSFNGINISNDRHTEFSLNDFKIFKPDSMPFSSGLTPYGHTASL